MQRRLASSVRSCIQTRTKYQILRQNQLVPTARATEYHTVNQITSLEIFESCIPRHAKDAVEIAEYNRAFDNDRYRSMPGYLRSDRR